MWEQFIAWLKAVLHRLVYLPGDDEETILLKKIWWIFVACFVIFPGWEVLSALVEGEMEVVLLSGIIVGLSFLLLVVFHFHRKNIETYGLVFQLLIVAVTSVKTLLTGGLVYSAGVVYVGLVGPIQAIIFPNKKRAVAIFILYVIAVIGGTLAQPYLWQGYKAPDLFFIETYVTKFIFGTFFVFFTLNYFTARVQKMKSDEVRRMKALDDLRTKFYTDITHEFRTPLAVILGMADQVKHEPQVWLEEGTKLIRNNGLRLLALINQMLDLSKLEAGAMQVTMVQDDIVAYAKYLTESFHSLAERKKVVLGFTSSLPQIYMDFDPEKLQNILSNLLSNAFKFTPEGGTIGIALRTVSEPAGEVLIIDVSDSGIGIPEKYLHRVFDRYFQVESHATPATAGTGLGLALTREVVQLMGGSIGVESRESHGAVFTVRLPIRRQAPKSEVRLQEKMPSGASELYIEKNCVRNQERNRGNKLRLLIVEDNPDVVRYLQAVLEQHHHIEVAYDGAAGWDCALEHVPDLVISDVMMPKMDGFELCARIKNDIRTSHIPVILLTARADMHSKLEGLESGADVYLAKPFDRQELLVHVRKLVDLRKMLQQRYKTSQLLARVPDTDGRTEDRFLQQVRTTLEAHLAEEDFGIEQLCRAIGMSRSQMYRKFQALTDATVHQFIREIRLHKARELLETTDMNVTEVAIEVGFKNLSHFSRVFSETWGKTPSEFRV